MEEDPVDMTQMIRSMFDLPTLFEQAELHHEKLKTIVDCSTAELQNLKGLDLGLAWMCVVMVSRQVEMQMQARRVQR